MAIRAAELEVIVGANTTGAENGLVRVKQHLGGVAGSAAQAGDVLRGVLGAQFIQAGITGLVNAGRAALDTYASYERLGMSLQALSAKEAINSGQAKDMTQAYAVTARSASELLGWTEQLAIKSPFTQQGVSQAFRMAMAYGFNTDQSKRLTKAMLDFTSATGASEDMMQRVALALGQIKARGKLAGNEIMQLTEAGLNVREILAQAFGKSTAEIVKMTEKGLIPADKAIEAITQSLERDFGGAAERQTATFSGLISTMSDVNKIGLRKFFEGSFKAAQPYIASVVDKLSSPQFMDALGRMGGMAARPFINLDLADFNKKITSAALVMDYASKGDWESALNVLGYSATGKSGLGTQLMGNPEQMVDEFIGSLGAALSGADFTGVTEATVVWSDRIWDWLMTAGAKTSEKMTLFLDQITIWAQNPDSQAKFYAVGSQLGVSIVNALGSPETAEAAGTALSMMGSSIVASGKLNEIGRSFTTGMVNGFVTGILGDDVKLSIRNVITEALTTSIRMANPATLFGELVTKFKEFWKSFSSLIGAMPLGGGGGGNSITGGGNAGTILNNAAKGLAATGKTNWNQIANGKAFGGSVAAGVPVLAGESIFSRPEVFIPKQGGYVMTKQDAQRAMGARSTNIYGLTINVDGASLASALSSIYVE